MIDCGDMIRKLAKPNIINCVESSAYLLYYSK